jgi:hypothetical protein
MADDPMLCCARALLRAATLIADRAAELVEKDFGGAVRGLDAATNTYRVVEDNWAALDEDKPPAPAPDPGGKEGA